MTRNIARSTPVSLLRAGAAALLLGSVLAACSGAASTPGAAVATSGAVGATAPASAPAAGRTVAPVATAAAAAGPTANPVLASALAKLNGLTSYQFKLTVKGGSYATSVGTGGVVGTVVNKPTFAVHFTYADLEIIEIQGKNWSKFGTDWVASKYGTLPTTYDSYGPANQLTHYFDASVTPYYTAAGDETVNGVLATRYKATPQILSFMVGNWGVTAANGNSDSLVRAGDIWIAKTGGYPVRWNVTATGGVAGAGSGGSANFEYLLDITKANDAGNKIVVPAS
ncbi:MAG TPA: hypothetical protein VF371_07825 [Candidatus Limnocylindrales bacterium]